MSAPAPASVRPAPSDESIRLLAARVRTGLWLIFLGIVVFGLTDLRFGEATTTNLHLLKLVNLPLLLAGFVALRLVRTRRGIVLVALAQIAAVCVFSALSGWVAQEQINAPMVIGMIVFVVAFMLPWGLAPQLVTAAIAAAAMLLHQWMLNGNIDVAFTHDGVIVAAALAASVFVAWDLARQREAQAEREQRSAASAVSEAEQRKSAVLSTALDAIITVDRNGLVLEMNPAAEAMFGYRREQVLGRHIVDFALRPQDREKQRRGLARAVATGTNGPFIGRRTEVMLTRADGSEFWAELAATRAGQPPNEIFTGYVRDLTERHRSERAQRRMVEILEATTDLVGTTDEKGKVIYYNAAGRDMLGFGRDEDLSSLRSIDNIPERFWKPVLEGSTAAALEGRAWRGEAELLTRDGRTIPVSQVVVAHRDAAGRVEAFSTIARDISEQKRTEAALHEEALVSGTTARVGHDLIAALDAPGLTERLCEVTCAALESSVCRTFLWSEERQGFEPIADAGDDPETWSVMRVVSMPPAAMAGVLPYLERGSAVQVCLRDPPTGAGAISAAEAGFPSNLTELAVRRGFTHNLYIPLSKGGKLTGFVDAGFKHRGEPVAPAQMRVAHAIGQMASLVIEHAQLMSALERANRLKSEFVATMSHELRTPLNVILGYNALLREGDYGPVTEEQREVMRRIERSSEELLDLINATLDMSRLDAGRIPLDVADVPLADVLRQVESETRHLKLRPGVALRFHAEENLPRLRTDAGKLRVILKNLIGNAVKFTETGTILVSAAADGEAAHVRVSDTGIGIPAASLPIIFEAFRQVDGSSTRKHGGVGLGLYIVRRLVGVLGGTIDVDSEEGKGSTFHVRLPLRATAPASYDDRSAERTTAAPPESPDTLPMPKTGTGS